jgi:hypothetical protein
VCEVTDIEIYRDGGTIEFRVLGSEADGYYRLQTPVLGTPEPLFRDGRRLEFGSAEEVAVLTVLQDWLAATATQEALAALSELEAIALWLNLPERLLEVVPLYHVRTVIQRMEKRANNRD